MSGGSANERVLSAVESTDTHLSDAETRHREAKRQGMMAKVPARYSGRAHWAFINLTTVLGIGVCLVLLERPVWWEWLFFLSDLNAPPGSAVATSLEPDWHDCCGPEFAPTRGWNTLAGREARPERLHYVYVRAGAGLTHYAARPVLDDPAEPPSDHGGIEVAFRLRPEEVAA